MPSPKRPRITTNGRPLKPIDWQEVDLMLEAGCPGTEIASRFQMVPDRFYDRCVRENGIGFTQYALYKLDRGKSNIRAKHYTKAMKGDNTMLLHCAKHMLNQWDTQEKDTSPKEEDLELKKQLYAKEYEIQQMRKELDDLKSKASAELQPSDASLQSVDRSGFVWEDICESGQAD